MKKLLVIFLFLFFVLAISLVIILLPRQKGLVSPLPLFGEKVKEQSLEKYAFENLAKREYLGSQIKLEQVIKEEKGYISYLFTFFSEGKKVSGLANLPAGRPAFPGKKFPVIVMIRGYADTEVYFTGLGTRKAAGFFAENGFITLSPDFLGFGDSEEASVDILEARFEKPVTVLNLLYSVKTLEKADPSAKLRVNPEKIFLWGHSNGGQIVLSVLEISEKPIPTVLWAPVTLGFPDSVLVFLGEMDDKGEKVKQRIDEFLKFYDPQKFSVDAYLNLIKAPLQIHQGTWDPLVDFEETNQFVEKMKSLGVGVTYFLYAKDDHNLKKNWDLAVWRDLAFFREYLKSQIGN